MKKHYNIIIVLLAVISLSACKKDFLEKLPLGKMSPESFFTDKNGLIQGTNAAYEQLRSWNLTGFSYIAIDIVSDDTDKGGEAGGSADNLGFMDNLQISPQTTAVSGWYNGNYQLIVRTNLILANIDDAEVDDQEFKDRIKAENRFLRAVAYLNLVRAFGGVAKITEPVSLNDPYVARSTTDEIWQLIDDDLEFAIDNLPEKSEYALADLGRATKGAARGLLARAYLFRNNFTKVEELSLAIIKTEQYQLYPDFGEIFQPAGNNCSESVFEVQASSSIEQSIGTDKFNTTQMPRGQTGWGFNLPTADLEAAFEPNDPRKDATIAYPGDIMYDGVVVIDYPTIEGGVAQYNQKAYIAEWEGGASGNDPGNIRVIRYSDILLMAAEAMNENGNPTGALSYLNMVRERARDGNNAILPDIIETDQSALRTIIWHERRVELAIEQLRFWDLVRQGRAYEVMQAHGKTNFVNGTHELWPIPQTEIDITEGIITQNPGY
ncbi:MAG: RagB/SusD family nutrient uptake outer membrane protein [Spirochaetes bacterium]|nr:MAG: RagB/SusD family nutrient uptake outer membrane protein [Spirochaetota bacterium]